MLTSYVIEEEDGLHKLKPRFMRAITIKDHPYLFEDSKVVSMQLYAGYLILKIPGRHLVINPSSGVIISEDSEDIKKMIVSTIARTSPGAIPRQRRVKRSPIRTTSSTNISWTGILDTTMPVMFGLETPLGSRACF